MEEQNEFELEEKIEKYKHKNNILIIFIIVMIFLIILIGLFRIWIISTTEMVAYKPIIYIYPEKETQVSVELSNPEYLTTTYPKYNNSWEVIAKPNGDLTDIKTGRKLYSLYWEGIKKNKPTFETGFVVKGEETAEFLEEKLEILGLNEREAEEFIIYWLPKMEHNPYNFIYFESMEEIDNNMKLKITPEPDTLIRVMMDFKPLKEYKEVPEQKLQQVEREGYTVVEWGGSEIK